MSNFRKYSENSKGYITLKAIITSINKARVRAKNKVVVHHLDEALKEATKDVETYKKQGELPL